MRNVLLCVAVLGAVISPLSDQPPSEAIRPFSIRIPDAALTDLKARPTTARLPEPTACADFPKEIIWSPRRWLEGRYTIVRWTEMPRGGHFAAFEQPALLVDDVRAFFAGLRDR